MAEIELKHVCKTYENGFEAVKDFNLKIEDRNLLFSSGPPAVENPQHFV